MQIKHIKKTKQHPKRLLTIILTLAIAITSFTIPTEEVYAAEGQSVTEVEAMYSDGTYTSSNSKWYATYAKDAGYKGQGVLLYLLEREGGGPVAGTTPKAYPCSADVLKIKLNAQDKYCRYSAVTTWENSSIPWKGSVSNNGAMMKNSITSNVTSIKAWLKTEVPSDGGKSTLGIGMVESIWGTSIAKRFTKEEIILVAEPIVAIQYSQYFKKDLELHPADTPLELLNKIYDFQKLLNDQAQTEVSPDLNQLFTDSISELQFLNENSINTPSVTATKIAKTAIINKLSMFCQNAKLYLKMGDPMAGTAKDLIAYYNELEAFPTSVAGTVYYKSESGAYYYRRSASACSYVPSTTVICNSANFNLWPAGQAARQYHSDSTIRTYSLGMLAACAWTQDDIEDKGEPGPGAGGGDYILNQSELTKKVNSDTASKPLNEVELEFTFGELSTEHEDCYYTTSECDGCEWDCDKAHEHIVGTCPKTCPGDHKTYHDSEMSLDDRALTLTLKRGTTTGTVVSSGTGYEPYFVKNDLGFTRSYTDATSEGSEETVSGYSYDFIVHRANQDQVKQYSGKDAKGNVKNESTLSSLFPVTNSSSSARRENGSVTANLSMKFELDADKADTTTTTLCEKTDCTHSDPDSAAVSYIDFTATTQIKTYAGLPSQPSSDDSDADAVTPQNFSPFNISVPQNSTPHASGIMVAGTDSNAFTFVPFIKMTAQDMNGVKHEVNVAGHHTRSMTPNSYAEITWFEKDNPNLNVISQRWSTHYSATHGSDGWQGTNQVLPGGALYGLNTKGSNFTNTSDDGQLVYVMTYQPILIGLGREQASNTGSIAGLDSATATQEHNSFVDSVKASLDKVELVQYVNKNPSADVAWENGVKVYPGADITGLNNGSLNASTDEKYYLREDVDATIENAYDSDLDVKVEGTTQTEYYTFYSDTEGNIYMVEANASGALIGTPVKLLSRGEKTFTSSVSNTAYKINQRTKVVDMLVQAVERNTGDDTSASWATADGKWYNEAFNGITIQVDKTILRVGLFLTETRNTILDPKLIPLTEGKADMFTKAFLTQYKTSDANAATIGTFKGASVQMEGMDMLFHSRKFYIPNVTVQDNR